MNENRTKNDVLEQNVSTLLEQGGDAPRIAGAARTRIKAELVARFGDTPVKVRTRTPLVAVGLGLAAMAALALILMRLFGHGSNGQLVTQHGVTTLADGSTYITEPNAKVRVLGPRRIRVEGAALVDVAPGKGTFIVETERGTIEVLGTRFVVDGEPARTTAAVVRGQVKLATTSGEVVLHAGEQGIAEPGRAPVRGPAPRLSHLASWARLARAEGHDIQPLHHGTLFARDPGVRSHPPWGEEYPLPIAELGLDVVVEDQVARVAIDQTFHNEAAQDVEGVYRFAIPPDAALQRLAMYVDGRLEESAVVERMQARRIYEELVYRRVDPALLEWAGTGRLSLRVYPIPAHQDKRLVLAYTQSLPKLYDDWTLTVPLPEVDQLVGTMNVAVRVKGCASCELASPSHQISVERAGDDAIVHYKHAAEKLGDSFVLHVRDARHHTTVARTTDGADRYLMVRAPVELGHAPRAYKPRTWVILDDVSASRGTAELHAQRDLIEAFVRELDEADRLAVIAFDVQARTLLAPTRVMDVDARALRQSLEHEGGVGATDFQAALDAATTALAGTEPDSAMIVYLGDGMITSGPRNLDALRAQVAGKAHFVGVGVGDGPDTQTLGTLASATGGYATTMDLADDLAWRAFDLVAALHTARVTGLEAKLVDAAGNLVPATTYLPGGQLADGEELEIVTRLAGSGTPAAVELSGILDGAPWHQRIAVGSATGEAGYLPRLWAQRHIAARLLAKHEPVAMAPCTATKTAACPSEAEAREARDEQIRREVVGLGKRFFLLSRHTSLLVLENDEMYTRYGVTKGAGDTWAPYALPSTIPVHVTTPTTPAATIAKDAELVRTPLPVFYDPGYAMLDGEVAGGRFDDGDGLFEGRIADLQQQFATRDRWNGNRREPAVTTLMPTTGSTTRAQLGLDTDRPAPAANDPAATADANKEQSETIVTTEELAFGHAGGRKGAGAVGGNFKSLWAGPRVFALQRLASATDAGYDDLTGFVPALFGDAADVLRARFAATAGTHAVDAAARTLLADARRKLPTGIYRWGEREFAVDDARRLGWRRTTADGLGETASYDGTIWTRRYAELGLDVTRPVAEDDIALALAYLPIWIADADHYARYFDVTAHGREVTLATRAHGKPQVAFVMAFDDQSRLVAIRDGKGDVLVEIAWTSTGPVSARLGDETIAVGFTGQAIADAGAWAHGSTQPGTVVELPGHLITYWQDQVAISPVASPAWRRAQRQLMVTAAATQNHVAGLAAYEALRAHGGTQLGDLVLASGAFASATQDQVAAAVAPFAQHPIARYLVASRAYAARQVPAALVPGTRDGFVGALWQLRSSVADLQASDARSAADEVVAMNPAATELRLVAATAASSYYAGDVNQTVRMWDAVAVGPYRNLARAQAAQVLFAHGQYDAAADRVVQLAQDLDLGALPAQLEQLQYFITNGRRGTAGWQLVYAAWRDRVLAGTSYAHVLALVASAAQHDELANVLARATELAGADTAKQLAVARIAVAYNQSALAERIVKPLLAKAPSHDLYQLAATIAERTGKLDEALADLEAAQDAGADDQVDLDTVRAELAHLIATARQLAVQSTGTPRERAVARAMGWGTRWRAVDPGNVEIDRQLGELLLAVGDSAGAWRQLSSVIERDPWSGTGYMTVAEAFERQGKVTEALPFWQQAIVIDQTNPTPRLRKAQALIALGRAAEGEQLLHDITSQKWHDVWSNVVYQAQELVKRR